MSRKKTPEFMGRVQVAVEEPLAEVDDDYARENWEWMFERVGARPETQR